MRAYRAGILVVLFGITCTSARAGLVLSFEAPGVQATSVVGVTTETFDSVSSGYFGGPVSTAVGSISSSGMIANANLYGGAGGVGKYLSFSYASGSETSTVTLNGPQSYFGFWWSATDAGNQIAFLSGGAVMGVFDPQVTLAALNGSYNGNPTANFLGQDGGEKFVYLNVYGTHGTMVDQIIFTNILRGTGFEMDNFSVRSQPVIPTGTILPGGIQAVPEPSSLFMAATGGLLGFGRWFRSRKTA